jgi:hypothetical protein
MVAAVAALCAVAMAACTGKEPRPAPSEPPPALSAQKLPAIGDVPGMVRAGDFLVMPGTGVACSSVQSRISAMEFSAKHPPSTAAVRLSNDDRSRQVIVGVWTYARNNSSGAPQKQLDELAEVMPTCTFDDKIGGRPATVTVDAPPVTGAPEGTRVFRTTSRGTSGVLQQAVIVYIPRPGSLLAVQDLRKGPAFPVEETVKVAEAALAKSSA